jgi:hypothetical protein
MDDLIKALKAVGFNPIVIDENFVFPKGAPIMGGCTFSNVGQGKTAKEAFKSLCHEATYEHGHGGYSGTIAEKRDFIMIFPASQTKSVDEARQIADDLIDNSDRRINDKWGPAGCIRVGEDLWYFFGWASS